MQFESRLSVSMIQATNSVGARIRSSKITGGMGSGIGGKGGE